MGAGSKEGQGGNGGKVGQEGKGGQESIGGKKRRGGMGVVVGLFFYTRPILSLPSLLSIPLFSCYPLPVHFHPSNCATRPSCENLRLDWARAS